ncbi:MAG: hypothetical protein RLY50_86 [Actinomycetota bacterium]|jgi:4-diphosphocytidyl-2-C-methyl-D-erythritol kinase
MTVHVEAPAKLTWSLRITGVRNDGYHLIDAEMSSLELADTVTIEESPQTSLTVDGPFATGVPLDETNLVWRALHMSDRTAKVHITKNIPHGGGLGGGSTDAAAILRWAGCVDLTQAASIGADVAFCVAGGRARVGGIGEIVEPLPHVARAVTLIVPPVVVSTPRVYARWDSMGGPTGDNGNDLEPAALAEVPALAEWRDTIGTVLGVAPRLAGSGATWFVEGHHSDAADLFPGATVVLTAARADAGTISAVR